METNTYTIPMNKREEIEKLIARYQRKAQKYGATLEAAYGKPYAVEVSIYEQGYDPGQHCTYSEKVDTVLVEAFDMTISSEIIRNGNYNVIAKLEHLNGANIVTTFNGAEARDAWRHSDCHCDHCRINRARNLTFIVRDGNGDEKQIGSTCLKEYCGIDPQSIGLWNQLRDICIDMEADMRERSGYGSRDAYDTIDALALSIKITKEYGYIKSEMLNSNREKMFANIGGWRPTEAERLKAEAMAKAIMEADEDTLFRYSLVLPNVRVMLEAEYCKSSHFGYIAYAPTDFKRFSEKLEEQRKREAEAEAARKSSQHVGKVGERITINVTEAKYVTSWETMYGMTHLYKFLDIDGNVYVWFASRMIDEAEVKTIKGTIKDHTERDGIKQTVLTRCKVA